MVMNRIRTIFTGVAGTPWYSNLYFEDDATSTTAQAQHDAVADFWLSFDTSIVLPVVSTVQGDIARINEATGDLVGSWAVTEAVNSFSSTNQPLPWATQGLIRFTTPDIVHNRRVRGKIFIPGLTEADSTDGRPTSGFVAALTLLGQNLIDAVPDSLVVWSRPFAGSSGNPARAGSSAVVTGCSGWTQWATQRTRRD